MKTTITNKINDKTKTLEELAGQQGIKPVQNIEEIFALWPEDDDPDEFLKFILKRREEERKSIRKMGL